MKKYLLIAAIFCFNPGTFASQTGYFIDAPVTGLFYKTTSDLQGVTDRGKYQYNEGDMVTFYLGNDDSAMVLASVSSQQIITPTLAAVTPSRSINMTRLLLSLDSTPENSDEILLASQALSDPEFQKQLKSINLSTLENYQDELGFGLVSSVQAAEHLSQSQAFIRQNFTSQQILLRPLNLRIKEDSVIKRDWRGNLCFFDVARVNEKDYYGPVGRIEYQLTETGIVGYPSRGDYFGSEDGSVSGCELNSQKGFDSIEFVAMDNYTELGGFLSCAKQGCTRNDLNGFAIDDRDDDGDWKYRTVAMNFDEKTGLFLQKTQGLGPNKKIHNSNRAEFMWFSSTDPKLDYINLSGIWQLTEYSAKGEVHYSCLYIKDGSVFQAAVDGNSCPETSSEYQQIVTQQYADMWWLYSGQDAASLAQLNSGVKWYTAGGEVKHTTWEYLPVGKEWDQGLLYRLEQKIRNSRDGVQKAETLRISELRKIGM